MSSQQLALSSNNGSSDSSGGEKENYLKDKKYSGSDFGQIIEEEKEEQKNNDEFNNRSHVHKRFQEKSKMEIIQEQHNNQVHSDDEEVFHKVIKEDQDLSPKASEDGKKSNNKNYLLNYM